MLDTEKILFRIGQITKLSNVTGFFSVRNPRFIGLEFINEEVKKEVEEKLQQVGNDFVFNLNWVSQAKIFEGKILWLPPFVTKEKILDYISKYFTNISLVNEFKIFQGIFKMKTGKYFFKAQLKQEVKIEEVPHLIYLEGFQALIIIKEREPMCLACEKIGHFAYQCVTPFCRMCHNNHASNIKCLNDGKSYRKTYAQTLINERDKEKNMEKEIFEEAEDNEDNLDIYTMEEMQQLQVKSKIVFDESKCMKEGTVDEFHRDMKYDESLQDKLLKEEFIWNKKSNNEIKENSSLIYNGINADKRSDDVLMDGNSKDVMVLEKMDSTRKYSNCNLLSKNNNVIETEDKKVQSDSCQNEVFEVKDDLKDESVLEEKCMMFTQSSDESELFSEKNQAYSLAGEDDSQMEFKEVATKRKFEQLCADTGTSKEFQDKNSKNYGKRNVQDVNFVSNNMFDAVKDQMDRGEVEKS